MQVTTVVFDKTGTITEGKPRVVAIVALRSTKSLPLPTLVSNLFKIIFLGIEYIYHPYLYF